MVGESPSENGNHICLGLKDVGFESVNWETFGKGAITTQNAPLAKPGKKGKFARSGTDYGITTRAFFRSIAEWCSARCRISSPLCLAIPDQRPLSSVA